MKFSASALLFLPVAVNAFAFFPSPSRTASSSRLFDTSAVLTGPGGKAASSFEEDLRLTLLIIRDHEDRSSTVSKEQFIQQVEKSLEIDKEGDSAPVVDISIPYDAAAKLAYEVSDKSVQFGDFKTKFEADAVADVIAKQAPAVTPEPAAAEIAVDISVPYDAAAKIAYEASDKSVQFGDFKTKFEADAVADVIAKQAPAVTPEPAAAAAEITVDISVPYDAAAKIAYEASDKSVQFGDFKTKFEADAVADVIAKQAPAVTTEPAAAAAEITVDISVPYDAAAKIAYEASDKSTVYVDFKTKFEADAVADVISKQAKE